MIPIIFINCDHAPFVDMIITRSKKYETRNRNTLGQFLGERVLIAETHHGRKPLVRCSAVIDEITECFTEEAWLPYIMDACISNGSKYDWQPNTKKKVLYRLKDVVPCYPFTPAEDRRHGRTWMEYHLP